MYSYFLILVWISIVVVALVSSTSRLMKFSFSSLIAGLVCFLYIYLERSFGLFFTGQNASNVINDGLGNFYSYIGLSDGSIVSQYIFILLVFAFVFLVAFITMSFMHIGGSPMHSKKMSFRRVCFILLYIVSVGGVATFFMCSLSPLFRVDNGFLSGFIDLFLRSLYE